MTTKKELRQRLDLHTAEITQLYQQLDSIQATVKALQTAVDNARSLIETANFREAHRQNEIEKIIEKHLNQIATEENSNSKRLDLHSKSLCDLHDKIDTAEEQLRRLEQNLATVERETDNQTAWNNAAQEKISAVERTIAKLQHAHQWRDKEELKLYQILASIQKRLSNQEQQPNAKRPHIPAGKLQRKPTPKQTATPKTSPAPEKTKLPTSTRAKRPPAQRRGRNSPRT